MAERRKENVVVTEEEVFDFVKNLKEEVHYFGNMKDGHGYLYGKHFDISVELIKIIMKFPRGKEISRYKYNIPNLTRDIGFVDYNIPDYGQSFSSKYEFLDKFDELLSIDPELAVLYCMSYILGEGTRDTDYWTKTGIKSSLLNVVKRNRYNVVKYLANDQNSDIFDYIPRRVIKSIKNALSPKSNPLLLGFSHTKTPNILKKLWKAGFRWDDKFITEDNIPTFDDGKFYKIYVNFLKEKQTYTNPKGQKWLKRYIKKYKDKQRYFNIIKDNLLVIKNDIENLNNPDREHYLNFLFEVMVIDPKLKVIDLVKWYEKSNGWDDWFKFGHEK